MNAPIITMGNTDSLLIVSGDYHSIASAVDTNGLAFTENIHDDMSREHPGTHDGMPFD